MWTARLVPLVIAQCVCVVLGQTCSLERAQQCRDDLQRLLRQETRGYRGQELITLCSSVRENMACLMWNSANCQSRDQQQLSGDSILSAKSFLDRTCDQDRGWRVSRCYQYDDIKRCESNLAGKGVLPTDSCRMFLVYKGCVKDVVGRRCSREDEQQLPSYLIDRARELSWQCGGTVGEARDIHSVYRAAVPAGYAPYTQGYSRTSTPQAPPLRYRNFSYVDSSSYAFTPPPARDTPTENSYCMLRARDGIEECNREHQKRQYNARRYYYSDERVRQVCCATVEYRECIRVVLREKCRDAGSAIVDSILFQETREVDFECRDFHAYRCSGCSVRVAGSAVVLCLVVTALSNFFRS